jgi:hypothetical protein
MKHLRIPLVAVLIVIPILVRAVWFYQGFFWRGGSIPTPEYNSYTIPQPPVSSVAVSNEPVASASGAVVLLDQDHRNLFSTSEVESLTELIHASGGRVEDVSGSGYSDRSLYDQLKYATAYISICPLVGFSTAEIQLLQGFVDRGGRLLILTDPTRSTAKYSYSVSTAYDIVSDVLAANTLLTSFDITFMDDYLYNMTDYEGNFRNVYFRDFGDNSLTDGLSTVVLYAAHSVQTKTGTLLLQTSGATKSSLTDAASGFSAAAIDSSGRVLAIGDMTFLQAPYDQVADNAVWIRHLAEFLLGAERVHDLKDFPFLFQHPVVIMPMSDITMDATLLESINSLQQNLAEVGILSSVAQEPADGKDLIVLGTYSSPKITKYVDPLGITLPSSSVYSEGLPEIEIPGFGTIPSYGIGLILLSRTESRTTLIVLSEDDTSISGLMGVIGPSGLSNCLLQGNVAICGVSGRGYYGG